MTEVNKNDYIGEEIKFDGSDWIVSPITKRAVAESVKVINAARKLVQKKIWTGIQPYNNRNGQRKKQR